MLENSIFRFSDIFHVAFYFPVECLPVLRGIDFVILGIKIQKQNKPGKNPANTGAKMQNKTLKVSYVWSTCSWREESFYQMLAKVLHCHWSKSSEALKSQQAKLGIFSGHMKSWLKRDFWKWIARIQKATYI